VACGLLTDRNLVVDYQKLWISDISSNQLNEQIRQKTVPELCGKLSVKELTFYCYHHCSIKKIIFATLLDPGHLASNNKVQNFYTCFQARQHNFDA